MDPVIEEMQEAAAGEDDGMLIKAVGVPDKFFGPASGWGAWPMSGCACLAGKVCVLGLQGLWAYMCYVVVHRQSMVRQQAALGCWRVCSARQSKRSTLPSFADVAGLFVCLTLHPLDSLAPSCTAGRRCARWPAPTSRPLLR